jgi:DNA-binding NarL/FixJ family response regulator
MQEMQTLRVLVVAGNPLARAGLAGLLASDPTFAVVGQVALEDSLESAIDVHRPDVIVCDLGYDAPRAAERLHDAADGPAVLALVSDSAAAAEAAPALFGAGVRGVLAQDTDGEALAAALRAIGRGLTVFGPEIALALLPRAAASAEAGSNVGFTPREREVLSLVAEGLPNKQIARQLHISEHTVKFHINALLTKLGAASRTEAVVRASRLGLISL